MKWFKQDSNNHQKYHMNLLMDQYGVAGYGYFIILSELCASEYEWDGEFEFLLHLRQISKAFQTSKKKSLDILTFMDSLSLFSLGYLGDEVSIVWPDFVDFRHKDAVSSSLRKATGQLKAGPKRKEENKKTFSAVALMRQQYFEAYDMFPHPGGPAEEAKVRGLKWMYANTTSSRCLDEIRLAICLYKAKGPRDCPLNWLEFLRLHQSFLPSDYGEKEEMLKRLSSTEFFGGQNED